PASGGNDMNCTEWEERVARFVDGEPDPAVAEHLAACPACAAFVDLMESDRVLLRQTPAVAEADFDRMRKQIRARIQPTPKRSLMPLLALAASILLMLAI